MAIDKYQAVNPFISNPNVNPFNAGGINGGAKVGGVEKAQPVDVYGACEALSMRDGRSPDISGSACGAKLDLCKDGCIDNLAWGI